MDNRQKASGNREDRKRHLLEKFPRQFVESLAKRLFGRHLADIERHPEMIWFFVILCGIWAPRRFVWIGAIQDFNPHKTAGKNNRDGIATFKHILPEHSPMLPPRQSSYLVIPAQAGIQQFPVKGYRDTDPAIPDYPPR